MKFNQKGFTLVEGLLIIIALSLVAGVGFYVYSVNQDNKKSDSSSEVVQVKKPDKQKEDVPELIEYKEAIEIRKPEDAEKLQGASESFKSFIASEIKALNLDNGNSGGCGRTANVIYVEKIAKDEFALGAGTTECENGPSGGARAVWKKTGDKWSNTDFGGHDWPACKGIIQEKIPPSIIETCYDEANPNADQFGQMPNPN